MTPMQTGLPDRRARPWSAGVVRVPLPELSKPSELGEAAHTSIAWAGARTTLELLKVVRVPLRRYPLS